jgi:tRNA-2-methylthio-N6-dimethylallyladenosine synthase
MRYGKYDLAFFAQYSPRPGAVAEKRFADDVEKAEKKRRHSVLTEDLKAVAYEKNRRFIGRTLPILVESFSRKDGKMLGRTEGLKSVEFDSADERLVGEFVDIEITNCDPWRLFGALRMPSTPPVDMLQQLRPDLVRDTHLAPQ